MRDLFSYDDIVLIPKYSELPSRKDADTSVNFHGHRFNLPVVPANMQDVISYENAKVLSNNGYFYIMHRFDGMTNSIMESYLHNPLTLLSISVGVNLDSIEDLSKPCEPHFITIDVAHAHHKNIQSMVKWIKENKPSSKLIAGNVATPDGYKYLCDLGVDAVKIGLGGGCFIPNTQIKTEFGNKNIQDIDVGEKVITHTGEYKPVTNTFAFDRNEELIKINDSITCTKNHEFYVIHKKDVDKVNDSNIKDYAVWVEAKDLTNEYFLIEMGE